MAPQEFDEGDFVVLDDMSTYPVIIEVEELNGDVVFGYTATLLSSPGGTPQEASVTTAYPPPAGYPRPTEPEELELPFRVPVDIDFEVRVSAKGLLPAIVPSSRFLFDGSRWIAPIRLSPRPGEPDSDSGSD